MLKDFKAFLLRGNVVDLAVAVVIGAAFGALVTALVRDLVTPIIALIFGKPNFSNLSFTINSSHFLYGDFINYFIAFISVAAAVFFFVVQPVNLLMRRRRTEPDVESETRPCTECLSFDPPRGPQMRFLHLTPGGGLSSTRRCPDGVARSDQGPRRAVTPVPWLRGRLRRLGLPRQGRARPRPGVSRRG